jgi:hypothetical protein
MSGNIHLDAGFAGTQRSIETLDNLIRIVYVLDIYY